MIPAGYLSSVGEMNFILAFLAGTWGALLGATINYVGGRYLGKPVVQWLIKSYGRYIFLKESHYEKSEKYFHKHWVITTLLGRFIPAVRQLISIPAGIFQMNYFTFILYTGIGAWLWNLILMGIGYVAWENRDLIEKYTGELSLFILVLVLLIAVWYVSYHKKK